MTTGPRHEFLLIENYGFQKGETDQYWKIRPPVSFCDDTYDLIFFSTTWFPTFDPVNLKRITGLIRYGPTILEPPSAHAFASILKAWISLFENGPQRLVLSHNPLNVSEAFGSEDRQEVIAELSGVMEICNQVANAPEARKCVLLHLGI